MRLDIVGVAPEILIPPPKPPSDQEGINPFLIVKPIRFASNDFPSLNSFSLVFLWIIMGYTCRYGVICHCCVLFFYAKKITMFFQ